LSTNKPTVIHIGEETLNAIEAALRALPIKDSNRTDAIPYSHLIPGIARHVLLMPRPNDLKRMRNRAVADLDEINKTAIQLAALIKDQLPDEQERRSNPKIRMTALLRVNEFADVIQLLTLLDRFAAAAARAREKHLQPITRGSTPKSEAFAIGMYLYQEYERLTGEKPRRTVRHGKSSGRFQTLLEKVFEAVKIRASGEAIAIRVMKENKKHSGHLTPFD
jgi:hypothetical protein